MELATRLLSSDWITTAQIMQLNDAQKCLMLILPNVAESNGCFESDPEKICYLTCSNMADLELLFKILVKRGLLESYEVQGKQYWYLPQFLDTQRLRVKSQVPSPPWLEWQPERGAVNQGHTSQGRYIDKRKQYKELPEPVTIDNKFTLEQEENKNMNKKREGVNILSNTDLKIYTENDLFALLEEIAMRVESLGMDYGTQKQAIKLELGYRARGMNLLETLEKYKLVKKDKWQLEAK